MVNVHQSNSIDQIPSPHERLSLKDLAVSSGDKIDCKSYISALNLFFYIITAFMAAEWKQKGLFPISKYLSCRFLLMETYIVIATEPVYVLWPCDEQATYSALSRTPTRRQQKQTQ